jgi:hypothetical protein
MVSVQQRLPTSNRSLLTRRAVARLLDREAPTLTEDFTGWPGGG